MGRSDGQWGSSKTHLEANCQLMETPILLSAALRKSSLYLHRTLTGHKTTTWWYYCSMPEVNHLLEMSGFHFDPICQIKCNNAMQVWCKATRHALDLMFLTNDQTHNGCRLQRVPWLNGLHVCSVRPGAGEGSKLTLHHTICVWDKSVSHQLQNTDNFSFGS